jgi:HB1, ASXL, restriction endonuclease HTH domain
MRSATKKNGSKKSTRAKAKPANPDLVPLTAIDKDAREAKKPKGKKTATPKADAKPKALSCLDAAAQVLKAKGEAMNCKAMIDAMFSAKLWHSDAPTPAATLSSAILREVSKKGKDARFKIVDRGQFVFNA